MKSNKNMSRQLQYKMLSATLEIMAGVGIPEASIRAAFERALVRSRGFRSQGARTWSDGSYLPIGDVSADLLRLWHRDSRCIRIDDALPRPLFVSKGRPSLRSLIRGLDQEVNVSAVLSFMRENRLIRRTPDGRYVPTADATTITNSDPVIGEHLARSVVRLLSTVRRNTDPRQMVPPLIERYAYVSNLNPQDAAAFAEFTKEQGLTYLKAVDDWMEQRRTPKRGGNRTGAGVVAGVQVIAYLGDAIGQQMPPSSRRARGTEGTDTAQAARVAKPPTSPPSTPA